MEAREGIKLLMRTQARLDGWQRLWATVGFQSGPGAHQALPAVPCLAYKLEQACW